MATSRQPLLAARRSPAAGPQASFSLEAYDPKYVIGLAMGAQGAVYTLTKESTGRRSGSPSDSECSPRGGRRSADDEEFVDDGGGSEPVEISDHDGRKCGSSLCGASFSSRFTTVLMTSVLPVATQPGLSACFPRTSRTGLAWARRRQRRRRGECPRGLHRSVRKIAVTSRSGVRLTTPWCNHPAGSTTSASCCRHW